MNELKSFARTIRMKESIRQYVEQQEGSSFSDKFENMVIFSQESEKKIDESIGEKESELAELSKKVNSYKSICATLSSIDWSIKNILDSCKKLDKK